MRLVLILGLVAALAGCGSDDPSVTAEQRDRPVVVTALGPVAELARTIGGDAVVVIDLTAVGRSPHELELTPRERREVDDAALAIVVGRGFQPELERLAGDRAGPTLDLLTKLRLPDSP